MENKISIIVRSYNDGNIIESVLDRILDQELPTNYALEILVADNESSDKTVEILDNYTKTSLKRINIAKGEYVPGKVLNACIKETDGNILVFNNSDCIPLSTNWLKNLVSPLIEKRSVISFANQRPRENAKALVKLDHSYAFPSQSNDINGNSEVNPFMFSLASSACTREIWEKGPFREDLQYSEDIEWSWRHAKNGFNVSYCSDSLVEHSHNYPYAALRKRFFNEGKADRQIFGDIKEKQYGALRFYSSLGKKMLRDIFYLVKTFNLLSIPEGLLYRYIQQSSLRSGYVIQKKNKST